MYGNVDFKTFLWKNLYQLIRIIFE